MVAYFVRRLASGATDLILLAFLLYCALVSPGPGASMMRSGICDDCYHGGEAIAASRLTLTYALDQPWPINFIVWLVNPDGPTTQTIGVPGELAAGGYIQLRNVTLTHSSLILGDFGESYNVATGHSTLELIGESFWLYDLIILSLTLSAMTLVLFKRIGHTPRFAPARFPFTPHDRLSLTFRYTQHP